MSRRANHLRTSRGGPSLPLWPMALMGGGVLAISVTSFFRAPLLPEIGRDLMMSPTHLGLATTAFGFGRLVADIPSGRLVDRVGPGAMVMAAGLFMAAGNFVLAWAPLASWVVVAFFLVGLSSSTMNTTGMTFFSTNAPVGRRGASMAVFSTALLVGDSLGSLVGGLLAAVGGWRASIVVAGTIGLGVTACGLAGFAQQRRVTRLAAATLAPARATSPMGTREPTAMRPAERFVLNAVPFAMFFMLGSMAQTIVPIMGDSLLALSAAAIGLALGLGGACRLLGGIVGGVVSDRVKRKAALVPGLTMSAAGVALLAYGRSLGLWLAAIVLLSLGSYGVAVAATMVADRSRPAEVGRVLGSYRAYGDLGLMIGPITATLIFDHVGRPHAILAVAGLLVLTAIAVGLVLDEPVEGSTS